MKLQKDPQALDTVLVISDKRPPVIFSELDPRSAAVSLVWEFRWPNARFLFTDQSELASKASFGPTQAIFDLVIESGVKGLSRLPVKDFDSKASVAMPTDHQRSLHLPKSLA